MTPPELAVESVAFGNWLAPDDVEALIPELAARYHARYARHYFGDSDDLEQVARVAVWQLLEAKGRPDRVREFEAFGAIHAAIQREIAATRRAGPGVLASQEVDWALLAVPDRQLTDAQAELLYRFRIKAAQAAGSLNWQCLWLTQAVGWEPEFVTLWLRRRKKRGDHGKCRVTPDRVRKLAALAERRIRKKLNPDYLTEINALSLCWWGSGGDGTEEWSVGRPDGRG